MQFLAGYLVLLMLLGAIGALAVRHWKWRRRMIISVQHPGPTIRELMEVDPRIRAVVEEHLYETMLTLQHGQRAARWFIYRYLPDIYKRRTINTYGPAYHQTTTTMEYPR